MEPLLDVFIIIVIIFIIVIVVVNNTNANATATTIDAYTCINKIFEKKMPNSMIHFNLTHQIKTMNS